MHPGLAGEVLTEEIIRLSNDFPTTVREKAKHDRDIKAKEAALTAMTNEMIAGAGESLGAAKTAEIAEQVAAASAKNDAEVRTYCQCLVWRWKESLEVSGASSHAGALHGSPARSGNWGSRRARTRRRDAHGSCRPLPQPAAAVGHRHRPGGDAAGHTTPPPARRPRRKCPCAADGTALGHAEHGTGCGLVVYWRWPIVDGGAFACGKHSINGWRREAPGSEPHHSVTHARPPS